MGSLAVVTDAKLKRQNRYDAFALKMLHTVVSAVGKR